MSILSGRLQSLNLIAVEEAMAAWDRPPGRLSRASSNLTTALGEQLGLGLLGGLGELTGLPAGLSRLQRKAGEVGLAEVSSPYRVAIGFLEELRIQRGTGRRGACGSIGGGGPRFMGGDLCDK